MSAEARLKELGLVLPALPKPVANYLPYRLAGNLCRRSRESITSKGAERAQDKIQRLPISKSIDHVRSRHRAC